MPDVSTNRELWDGGYNWAAQGEEWSHAWGGSEPQWFGAIYPRLHRALPASSILEIAPGMGRWTRFLLPLCRKYVGVDISLECVQGCQERFTGAHHARFMQNDGYSLSEVEDHAFDLVFSFDSLVHAEFDVFNTYIPQIIQKLNEGGIAFIHHSNMGAVGTAFGYLDGPLGPRSAGGRSLSVSRQNVEALIVASGGRVLIQEVINWSEAFPEDCLTMFAKHSSRSSEPVHLYNLGFMDEANAVKEFQSHYSVIGNRSSVDNRIE
jgi:SAM-dependent methyltransferase